MLDNSSNTWILQSAKSYQATATSFPISATGAVIMPNCYSTSDERIKPNIKTNENALTKVCLNLP